MTGSSMTDSVLSIAAHVKLNLFLRVLAREDQRLSWHRDAICSSEPGRYLNRRAAEDTRRHHRRHRWRGRPAHRSNHGDRAARLVRGNGPQFGVHLRLENGFPYKLDSAAGPAMRRRRSTDELARRRPVLRHELLQFAARLRHVPFLLRATYAMLEPRAPPAASPLSPSAGPTTAPPVSVSTSESICLGGRARHRPGAAWRDVALDGDSLSRWGDIGRMAGKNIFENE